MVGKFVYLMVASLWFPSQKKMLTNIFQHQKYIYILKRKKKQGSRFEIFFTHLIAFLCWKQKIKERQKAILYTRSVLNNNPQLFLLSLINYNYSNIGRSFFLFFRLLSTICSFCLLVDKEKSTKKEYKQ